MFKLYLIIDDGNWFLYFLLRSIKLYGISTIIVQGL